MKGTIKKLLREKQCGWIVPEGGGADVWFSLSGVAGDPQEGAPVEFERVPSRTKPGEFAARSVRILGAPPPAPSPSAGAPARQAAPAGPAPVFKDFYQDGQFRAELFFDAPAAVAKSWRGQEFKATQFRAMFDRLRWAVAPICEGRSDWAAARARFGQFYVEKIVRQNLRKGNQGSKIVPDIVKTFFDTYKDLALSSPDQMIGLFRYVTNIYCYFGEKDEQSR